MKSKARAELTRLLARVSDVQSLLSTLLVSSESRGGADLDALRRRVDEAERPVTDGDISNLTLALARPAVGVGAVLLDRESSPVRVLVGQRKASHGSGRFALPGGHLECAESFEACAARETAEETGVELPVVRWRQVATTNDWMEADGLHYVTVFMCAELSAVERAAVRNLEPDKCEGWRWLTWAEAGALPAFLPLSHFISQGHAERL